MTTCHTHCYYYYYHVHSTAHAKLLRMERDHHELQYDFDMFKKRSERARTELEKTNKKLNTQIHNDRKEIARLKEVMSLPLCN